MLENIKIEDEVLSNYSMKNENTYKKIYDSFYYLYYDRFIKGKSNQEDIKHLINAINNSSDKDIALSALDDVIRDIEDVKLELINIKSSLLDKENGFVKVISNNKGSSFMWILGLITGIVSCSLIILFAFLF